VKKLNSKQTPQVIILGLLAAGMFGFFIYRMVTPSKAAANIQSVVVSRPTHAAAVPATVVAYAAPPPSLAMRDPFIPGITDPAAMAAYQTTILAARAPLHPAARTVSATWNVMPATHANPLPNAYPTFGGNIHAGLTAAPIGLPAGGLDSPQWTVTGVVSSGGGEVAILRDGDNRRMVRRGEMVDGQFRVVTVEQNKVILAKGKDRFSLPIGGEQKVAPAVPTPGAGSVPQGNTLPDLGAPPVPSTAAPGTPDVNSNAAMKPPRELELTPLNIPTQ
jgi:hypothetical protein